jgi:hypothetical protein
MADTVDLEVKLNTKEADEWKARFQEPMKIDVEFQRRFQGDLRNFAGPPQGYGGAPAVAGGSSMFTQLQVLHMREEIKYFKTFNEYQKLFKPFTADMAQFTKGVVGFSTNLLKLLAGGALGGAAGFLGGVMPLAKSMVDDRKAALQLGGADLGKMRAAGIAFGNIMDVPGTVSKIAQGQFDIGSPAYTALKLMGFSDAEIQGSDPSDLLAKAMTKEQRRMQSYPNRQTAITQETARGATNIFSPDALRALGALPKGELEDREKQYQDIQKSLDLSQKEQQAIDELTRHVNAAGAEIETVFEKNLAKMAPYLTEFSDWIADFVVNRIPHEPGKLAENVGKGTIKDFVIPFVKMNETIDKWFGDMFGGAKQKTEQDFTDALKAFTDWWKNFSGNLPSMDAAPQSLEVGGTGGGFRIPGGGGGAPASLRARTTAKGDIRFPSGGARGKGDAGFGLYASDIGLVASKMDPAEAAFLDTLGTGETPRGSYSNPSGDPGGLGGRYQFLLSTWNKEAALAGVNPKDFSPENQDKVALFYAKSVVKGKTGHDLDALLKSSEGVREAIAALSPGVWNAVTNIDPDKRGHSGAVALFMKKLKEEQDAQKAGTDAPPKTSLHLPDVYKGGTSGESSEYPAPGEKVYGKPLNLNNMDHYQGNKNKYAISIHNPAGASYTVAGGMLGATQGNFGNS